MTVDELLSLGAALVLLAALPSSSVALVVTRAATRGVSNGVAVGMGIVLGDLVFVLLALLGLSAAAEVLGGFFAIVKVAGAIWLIGYGWSLLRKRDAVASPPPTLNAGSGWLTSFMAGFFLTLGDIKAILFYASFFPLFVDPASLTISGIAVVMLLTFICVGGVKTVYALLAVRIANTFTGHSVRNGARTLAGTVMMGAGTWLIIKNT